MMEKDSSLPLAGSKVTLRAVEPADTDFIYMLENEPGCARSSFATAPASRQMIWRYIEEYSADIYADKQLRLIIADSSDGNAVGSIDISDFNVRDRRGFVGIAILEKYRGRGYGHDALDILCGYAANILGMHQLAAIVAVDNVASRALFEGAGFATAGRLRSWLRVARHYTDVLVYQRLFM